MAQSPRNAPCTGRCRDSRCRGRFPACRGQCKNAGFDGVEVHGANGYLVDQFLRDGSNKRTGPYGGSTQNRARFLMEILQAICGSWDAGRVGLRISPLNSFNDVIDSDPVGTYTSLAENLNAFNLAFCTSCEQTLQVGNRATC